LICQLSPSQNKNIPSLFLNRNEIVLDKKKIKKQNNLALDNFFKKNP
jgi:hypothetical protein